MLQEEGGRGGGGGAQVLQGREEGGVLRGAEAGEGGRARVRVGGPRWWWWRGREEGEGREGKGRVGGRGPREAYLAGDGEVVEAGTCAVQGLLWAAAAWSSSGRAGRAGGRAWSSSSSGRAGGRARARQEVRRRREGERARGRAVSIWGENASGWGRRKRPSHFSCTDTYEWRTRTRVRH